MSPIDHSAEYYCLREGHERALALAARSACQRNAHLAEAARYGELARSCAAPVALDRLQPAFPAD